MLIDRLNESYQYTNRMNLFYFFGIYPFVYSFIEWNIHRLLHVFESKRHTEHHILLKSDKDYASSLKKSIQVFVIASPLFLVDSNIVSLWVNYTMYEFVHCWLHRNPSSASTFHNIHHHSKGWDKNYGVLSPFWDRIFGTIRMGKRHIHWWKYIYNWNPYLVAINF